MSKPTRRETELKRWINFPKGTVTEIYNELSLVRVDFVQYLETLVDVKTGEFVIGSVGFCDVWESFSDHKYFVTAKLVESDSAFEIRRKAYADKVAADLFEEGRGRDRRIENLQESIARMGEVLARLKAGITE